MKTATINFKTDEVTKTKARDVANSLGIPLSNLLNAYLYELISTGSVHFTTVEMMTPQMEKIIEQAEKEINAGETSGPFETTKEAITYLKSL